MDYNTHYEIWYLGSSRKWIKALVGLTNLADTVQCAERYAELHSPYKCYRVVECVRKLVAENKPACSLFTPP